MVKFFDTFLICISAGLCRIFLQKEQSHNTAEGKGTNGGHFKGMKQQDFQSENIVKCCTILEFAMKKWYDKTTKKKGLIHGKYI